MQFSNYTAIDAPADADIFLVYDDSAGATRKVTLQQLGDYIDTDQGFVTGPGSSTDNAVARFDATTGKIVQASGVIIDDSNNVTGVASLTTTDLTASGTVILKGSTMSTFGASLIDDADALTARATLGLVINTDVQAYDADLAAIAALNPSANNLIYKNGSDAWDVTTITTFGASLIDDANASTARSTLGLVIGTNVQEYSANLTAIAGLSSADGNFIVGSATGWVAESGATARTSLGLGNVENTALSTWAGSANITTLGTIATGTWQGTPIANAYVAGLDQNVLTTSSPTFAGLVTGLIWSGDATSRVNIAGGSVAGTGADIALYGESHATLANQILYDADLHTFRTAAGVETNGVVINASTGTIVVRSDLTLASGSITSASGAISFGNENLSTDGWIGAGRSTATASVKIEAYQSGGQAGVYSYDGTDWVGFRAKTGGTGSAIARRNGGTFSIWRYSTYPTTGFVGTDLDIDASGNFNFQSGSITTTGTLASGAATVTRITSTSNTHVFGTTGFTTIDGVAAGMFFAAQNTTDGFIMKRVASGRNQFVFANSDNTRTWRWGQTGTGDDFVWFDGSNNVFVLASSGATVTGTLTTTGAATLNIGSGAVGLTVNGTSASGHYSAFSYSGSAKGLLGIGSTMGSGVTTDDFAIRYANNLYVLYGTAVRGKWDSAGLSVTGTLGVTGKVYVGDTANANMTVGLTINQGANDDEILAFKSSDVNTNFTTLTEADTFGYIRKVSNSLGGLQVVGIAEAAGGSGFIVTAGSGAFDTTHTTAGGAAITLRAFQHNGSNAYSTPAANSNILAIAAHNGSSYETKFIFDYEGDTWQTGSLTTGAPSGGTAAPWKLGTVSVTAPTSPNRTIEVDINGTTYYIHAKTTND